MLLGADGQRFGLGTALFWAFTWGLGVAIGVALGGWLTLVGGAGAPGAEGIDPILDLLALPVLAGAIVMILHLAGQLVASALRGRAVARAE
jgi:hypothetical protein